MKLKYFFQRNSGFTLIEVMIAITILSGMAMVIWRVSSSMSRTAERSREYDHIYQHARISMRMITHDVQSAFMLGKSFKGKYEGADQAIRETAFIGENNSELDALYFASFSHKRMKRNSPETDQQEVGYFVETDPANSDILLLKRSESIYLDGNIKEGGTAHTIAKGITGFNLSYFDNKDGQWSEVWNSTSRTHLNKLPAGVRVELRFKNPNEDADDISFVTAVNIPLTDSPIEF